jgi:hypothetical protein
MTAPNIAVEPTTYSFGSALLRLRFRWRLMPGVGLEKEQDALARSGMGDRIAENL